MKGEESRFRLDEGTRDGHLERYNSVVRKVDLELTAAVEDLRRQLATPVTEEELEERRVAYRSMETLRVKVGPDFNIVDEVRKMRGGWTPKPDA